MLIAAAGQRRELSGRGIHLCSRSSGQLGTVARAGGVGPSRYSGQGGSAKRLCGRLNYLSRLHAAIRQQYQQCCILAQCINIYICMKLAADRHISSYLFVEEYDFCGSNLDRNASDYRVRREDISSDCRRARPEHGGIAASAIPCCFNQVKRK